MLKVCVASKNAHKIAEYQELLEPLEWTLVPLPDGLPDCPEPGESFEANAMEKAVFYSARCGMWVLADDSGLMVPALNGEPGVHSARYAGSHGDDKANNEKLLTRLRPLPEADREAMFVCSLALWHHDVGKGVVVRGTARGTILYQPEGESGFGYDPLFYYPPLGKSFGQMTPAEKNQVSHRSHAVQALMDTWKGGADVALMRGE